ncbi:MAG: hypothetical protein K6G92_13460 [Bacteroidaceae bacterium]|nr:hypothetical protein [Bacteroidaceae bacterium]
MKKIYNQPTCLVVKLGTTRNMMQATSLQLYNDEISDAEDILVKGTVTTDIDLWDEEW